MPTPYEVAYTELDRCRAIALERYGYDQRPPVVFDIRGLKGGYASYADGVIHLNAKIAAAEGEAYAQTVAHELAHLVVWWRWQQTEAYKRGTSRRPPQPHGLEWQTTMMAFGRPANRCHNYKSAERAVERRLYVYLCKCADRPEHRLSVVRHRKIERGAVYRCRACRARLSFQP